MCWMDEGLSLASWERQVDGRRTVLGTSFIEAIHVSGRSYREGLEELTGERAGSRIDVRWIVLCESFPNTAGERDCLPALPGWVTRCWDSLEFREIPSIILSGRRSLETALENWAEYSGSGTGICLQVGGRILLIAHGNGVQFHRLSRKGLVNGIEKSYVSREWLFQSRLLFRNCTGAALLRILIPEGRECSFSFESEQPLEIIPGIHPPGWTRLANDDLDDGLQFLHYGAMHGGAVRESRISFPILQKRRRAQKWDHRLKAITCLLLGGWAFLLMGACQHAAPSSADGPLPAEAIALKSEMAGYDAIWRKTRKLELERKKPYHLVGTIAQSKPREVEVKRIHIERMKESGHPGYSLELAGAFDGEDSTGVFRDWLDDLRERIGLHEIRDLRFDRNDRRIQFFMHGLSREGVSP